jgi:desulfoferrodoxin (superoxide reductase-like protein)
MFNPMKVPCPKCNSKGHKSEQKAKWISVEPSCKFCLGTHYIDWIELATGGKRLQIYSYSGSSSSSSSSSMKSSHIKPIRRKDDYVRNQKIIPRSNRTSIIKT